MQNSFVQLVVLIGVCSERNNTPSWLKISLEKKTENAVELVRVGGGGGGMVKDEQSVFSPTSIGFGLPI